MNESENVTKNKGLVSPVLIGEIVAFFALMILEVYLIKRIPENYLVLLGVGILILTDVFLIVETIIKVINRLYTEKLQQIEEYMKSQKAIYLANKRGFENVIEKLDEVDKSNREAVDNLFTGQKTIGKTIIKKNMESLSEVRAAIGAIRIDIPDFGTAKNETQEDGIYNLAFDIEKSKQAIVDAINSTGEEFSQVRKECVAIKEACGTLIDRIEQFQSGGVVLNTVQDFISPEEPAVEEPAVEETVIEQPAVEEPIVEETVFEEPVVEEPAVEEPSAEEPVAEEPAEEEPKTDAGMELTDPNKQLSADEIAALFAAAEQPSAEEPVVEEVASEEPVAEEPVAEKPEEEPKADAGMELTNPNKQLSADEIAALFAAAEQPSAGEPVAEEAVAEEPFAEEPVVEEPAPAGDAGIDLSDPNKQLSPDEIAALFAAMQ